MKIFHIADVQLGKQFKYLGDKARVQREQVKETFHRVLSMAVDEKVGVIAVAGDLFDTNYPSLDLVNFIKGEFKFLKERGIRICIVPGHHDALTVDGIYNRERFDDEFENVFIFRNPLGEAKEYADCGLAVFAKPNISSTSTKTPFPDVSQFKSEMKTKILLAHGDLQIPGKSADNYHPISISEIENMEGIDYVALGHWHSLKDCSAYSKGFKVPVFYSGSPELVDKDQYGSGNILIVDFEQSSPKITVVPVGKRKSLRISLDVSSFLSVGDIKEKIASAGDENTILQVELAGINVNNIFLNTNIMEEELSNAVFHIDIGDKTHLALNDLPEYPDKLVQGQFVKIMRDKISLIKDAEDKKIHEDALQFGLAELDGTEVI